MLELFFFVALIVCLVIVLKRITDKAAYRRKIARSDGELQSRVEEIVRQRSEDSHSETATNEWRKTEIRQEREPPPTRKHAKPEIDKFLNVKRKTRIIVFDVETNGLYNECSVLACSAIKYVIDPNTYEMTEIGRFDRYYYPMEQFNPQAIAVNGLTREVITEKRGEAAYPEYFCIDSDFETFCSDTKRFIAHNISFDMQFVQIIGNKKKLCTMKTNMDIVAVEFMKWKNEWKWPKLSETAVHYGISFNESDLHNSMADTEITAKIFIKMLETARING